MYFYRAQKVEHMSFFATLKQKLHRKSIDESIDDAFGHEKTTFSEQVLEGRQRFESSPHPSPMSSVNAMTDRNFGMQDIDRNNSQPLPTESFRRPTSQDTPNPLLAQRFARERQEPIDIPPDLMFSEPTEIGSHPMVNRNAPSMPPPLETTDKAREFIGTRQGMIPPTGQAMPKEPYPRPIMKNEKTPIGSSEDLLQEIADQQRNIISILREIQKHMRI